MIRTSRCFAGSSFQLGRPDTLKGVERFHCNLRFADFSFAHFQLFSAANFFGVSSDLEATSQCGSQVYDQKGERAARLVAAC
jgi:hypothetical protein